jgi:hypothetical protein
MPAHAEAVGFQRFAKAAAGLVVQPAQEYSLTIYIGTFPVNRNYCAGYAQQAKIHRLVHSGAGNVQVSISRSFQALECIKRELRTSDSISEFRCSGLDSAAVYRDNGYHEVKAPQVLDRSLWEKSGHWEKYRDNMFTTESENRYYALKPMNCPGHVQIYNANLHSYRELPLRYGEFGACHRNEPSGSLHGLMRVRGFTQDDGHIFCTEDQILDECVAYTALLQKVYRDFGFEQMLYKVATRPEQRIGSDEIWDKSEAALIDSLRRSDVDFEVSPGEGAFYGPKIEYSLKDAIGRPWHLVERKIVDGGIPRAHQTGHDVAAHVVATVRVARIVCERFD